VHGNLFIHDARHLDSGAFAYRAARHTPAAQVEPPFPCSAWEREERGMMRTTQPRQPVARMKCNGIREHLTSSPGFRKQHLATVVDTLSFSAPGSIQAALSFGAQGYDFSIVDIKQQSA